VKEEEVLIKAHRCTTEWNILYFSA